MKKLHIVKYEEHDCRTRLLWKLQSLLVNNSAIQDNHIPSCSYERTPVLIKTLTKKKLQFSGQPLPNIFGYAHKSRPR